MFRSQLSIPSFSYIIGKLLIRKVRQALIEDSNIDRLLAMWQTLNPSQYLTQETGLTHKLYPFRHGQSDDEIYISSDVQDWTKLGYQYQLLEKHDSESQEQYVARIKQWISDTYNHGALNIVKNARKVRAVIPKASAPMVSAVHVQSTGQHPNPGSAGPVSAAPSQHPKYHDYIIDVLYDR